MVLSEILFITRCHPRHTIRHLAFHSFRDINFFPFSPHSRLCLHVSLKTSSASHPKTSSHLLTLAKTASSSTPMTDSRPLKSDGRPTTDGRPTVEQNNQESKRKYWAIRSSLCSFAPTTLSFAGSAPLALLARSTSLSCSLARSLTHFRARGKV